MLSASAENSIRYGLPAIYISKKTCKKLIFPEGVYYDRKTQSFRTEKVNFISELIASSSGTPPEYKKGTSYLIDYLSLSAEKRGIAFGDPGWARQNKTSAGANAPGIFI